MKKILKQEKKNSGPPNRMNDLPYSDWMKFRKSFDFFEDDGSLYFKYITFFTKRTEKNRRSLVCIIYPKCDLNELENRTERKIVIKDADQIQLSRTHYKYLIVDLRNRFKNIREYNYFIKHELDIIFKYIINNVEDGKYFTFFIEDYISNTHMYPLSWALSYFGRKYARLTDEKIYISDEVNGEGQYSFSCVTFHNIKDERIPDYELFIPSTKASSEKIKFPRWIIPKPVPREKGVLLHPAKFPETIIGKFLNIFSPEDGIIFDPMCGTGSTQIACLRTKRNSIGFELEEQYVNIAKQRIALERMQPSLFESGNSASVFNLNAVDSKSYNRIKNKSIDYCITSPPYWDVLRSKGSEYQRGRRKNNLPTYYSENENDLGNIKDYSDFILKLADVYELTRPKLKDLSYMTIIVKNILKNRIQYNLAWDIVVEMEKRGYQFDGYTLWCQDDISMKPFAVGILWVSNTVHHYCLNFRKS